MEIRLERPALNNFKAYAGGKNEKPRSGDFEVKNFSYAYSYGIYTYSFSTIYKPL